MRAGLYLFLLTKIGNHYILPCSHAFLLLMDSQKQLIIITTHQTTLPKDTTYKTEYNYENGRLFTLHQKRKFGTLLERFNGLGTDGLGTVMRSNFLFSVPNPLIRSKNRKLERFWNGLTD